MDKIQIDLKYEFVATNPCSGSYHNQFDAMVFLAKDRAFLEGALPGYLEKCIELGANPAHIEAIQLVMDRVRKYQEHIESKVPDTDLPCEIRRCVDGILPEEELKTFLKPADIEATIIDEEYITPSGTMTICILTLRNGAKVQGINYGAIDPSRQDWEQGKTAARAAAVVFNCHEATARRYAREQRQAAG